MLGGGEARSSEEAVNPVEQRGLSSRDVSKGKDNGRLTMALKTPEKVRKFQRVLYAKAKESPNFRFYSLYDKLYRKDILQFSWRLCRENKGVAGIDRKSFEDIEAEGVEEWIGELSQELREKRYKPQALQRVYISKRQGGKRPLSIPTIKDRVVQRAAMLILAPVFEPDLMENQYAYRPKRKATDAVRKVHRMISEGYCEVVDADLRGYFDTIPHSQLMKSLARRISDGQMLKTLKMWLEMAVEERDKDGRLRRRMRPSKKHKRGIAQGSPISPLLSNIYMRRFLLAWRQFGLESELSSRIVNFADDFVILCKKNSYKAKMQAKAILEKMGLKLNTKKTQIVKAIEKPFQFLGYEIRRCYSPKSGKTYISTLPSKESVQDVCRQITEMTGIRTIYKNTDKLITEINSKTVGWSNYFRLGPVSKSYRRIDMHVKYRLRQWLCKKHKIPGQGTKRYTDEMLYKELGVVYLQNKTSSFPWANA